MWFDYFLPFSMTMLTAMGIYSTNHFWQISSEKAIRARLNKLYISGNPYTLSSLSIENKSALCINCRGETVSLKFDLVSPRHMIKMAMLESIGVDCQFKFEIDEKEMQSIYEGWSNRLTIFAKFTNSIIILVSPIPI